MVKKKETKPKKEVKKEAKESLKGKTGPVMFTKKEMESE